MKKSYNTLLCGLLLLCAVSCRQSDAVPAEERNELIEQIREINSLNITPDSMHVLLNALWDENAHRMTENEKVVFYNQRGNIYLRIPELEAAETNYLKALYYLKKLNDGNLGRQVAILTNIGVVRANQGNFDEALDIYQQVQTLIENDPNEAETLLMSHLNRVDIFITTGGEIDLLLYHAQSALDIAAQKGFRHLEAHTLIAIATVLTIYLNRYSQAEENLRRAIPILTEYNNQRMLWIAYHNLASILFALDRLEDGLVYVQKSNEIAAAIGFPQIGMAAYYKRRGGVHLTQGDYADSLTMLYQALALIQQMPDARVMAEVQTLIGEAYRRTGNFDTAYFYLDAARSTVQASRLLRLEADVQGNLAVIYAARCDMDNFLTAIETERKLRQRLFNEQNARTLQEVQARYEREIDQLLIVQQAEKIRYTQRNIIFLFVVLSLVVLLFIITFVFYRKKVRNMHYIVKQHEAYLKYKHEVQLQSDVLPAEQSASEKLALALQQLFETEKIYRRQGLSVDEVTLTLNTNSKYLTNAIKEHFQKGFVEYVNTFRVEDAIEMLKEQEKGGKYAYYSVEAIAEAVGFGNRATFYRAFKRILGITPREYMDIVSRQKKEAEEKAESAETMA